MKEVREEVVDFIRAAYNEVLTIHAAAGGGRNSSGFYVSEDSPKFVLFAKLFITEASSMTPQQVEDYLIRMRTNSIYGTDLEIRAAAQLYNINIDVFKYQLDNPEHYSSEPLDEEEKATALSVGLDPNLLPKTLRKKSYKKETLAIAWLFCNHYQPIVKASNDELKNYFLI